MRKLIGWGLGILLAAGGLSHAAAPPRKAPAAKPAARKGAGPALKAAAPVDARFFTEKVRPLLLDRCIGCHAGPEAQAKLDLSTRAATLKGSAFRSVARAGHSKSSILVRRVAEGTMPPKERLSPAEVEVLRRWVDGGMPWAGGALRPGLVTTATRAGLDWWSLQPLRAEPAPAPEPAAGPEGPPESSRLVDAFLARRLRREGLAFAPEASRAVFIRRVTYDLHGLPPTPEEVDAFLTDTTPGAYERLVDRLLASPRFGERAARRWLDAVRFAESDGYEHDLPRPQAWPYRDWVIDAFNRDLPYHRFIEEQLAGDALRPEDPKAGIPTGFLVAGGHDAVGAKVASGIMRAEVRQDELEDMIGTTTQVFLGLTAQCARCHDHKFDPISQVEYFRLQATLAGAQHWGQYRKHEYYGVRSETPTTVRLLKRGVVTAPAQEVTPGALSALRMLPGDLRPAGPDGDRERRLRLAEWITDPRNPLTPRVIVNRVWGWLFGQGLVETPNDFGFNGDRPSHPDLLDWLARDFMAGGWSMKRLHRQLVLSRAYRRGTDWNAAAARRDGGNRLLWRRAPRRLEAEELRDSMLFLAARMNPAMGGPGYQLFAWTNNAGALYTPVDPEGEEYCRRGIYRMVVRGGEDPLLASFDCPDSSNTTPRREVTTTATQALSLLNNSFVDRLSGYLAERLRREAPGSPEAQVRLSYRLAFGREPAEEETRRAAAFAGRHGLKEWCRVLFNAGEFLYVE